MSKHPKARKSPVSSTAQVGDRVMKELGNEGGTVIDDANSQIKVKWDKGSTSYFKRGAKGNIRQPPNSK